MKSNVVLPPAGVFMHLDVYSHKSGEECNALQVNLGVVGERFFFSLLCRAEENRTILKETSRLGMLFHE